MLIYECQAEYTFQGHFKMINMFCLSTIGYSITLIVFLQPIYNKFPCVQTTLQRSIINANRCKTLVQRYIR
jgi:hypothetical protein